MSNRARIGERIREIRTARRWDQTDLANEMRAHGFDAWRQTTVSRTERGERPLHFDEGFAIARILSVEPGALIGNAPMARTLSRIDCLAHIERLIQVLKDDEKGDET